MWVAVAGIQPLVLGWSGKCSSIVSPPLAMLGIFYLLFWLSWFKLHWLDWNPGTLDPRLMSWMIFHCIAIPDQCLVYLFQPFLLYWCWKQWLDSNPWPYDVVANVLPLCCHHFTMLGLIWFLIFEYHHITASLPHTGNPYLRESLCTVHLLGLTSSNQLLLKLKTLFTFLQNKLP